MAINGQAKQLRIQRSEIIGTTGKCHEFRCANWGEVGGMRKEDQPFALIICQSFLTVCGQRIERRRGFVKAGQRNLSLGCDIGDRVHLSFSF
jgi:hypothetical protein